MFFFLSSAVSPNLLLSYGFFLLLLLLLSFWQFATPSTYVIRFWPNLVRSMYGGGDSYKSLTRIGGPGSPGTSGVKNVKQCSMTTKLGQKNHWCKLKMMMTFTEVKGQQRSNVVNNILWLPNLVRRIPDAS